MSLEWKKRLQAQKRKKLLRLTQLINRFVFFFSWVGWCSFLGFVVSLLFFFFHKQTELLGLQRSVVFCYTTSECCCTALRQVTNLVAPSRTLYEHTERNPNVEYAATALAQNLQNSHYFDGKFRIDSTAYQQWCNQKGALILPHHTCNIQRSKWILELHHLNQTCI